MEKTTSHNMAGTDGMNRTGSLPGFRVSNGGVKRPWKGPGSLPAFALFSLLMLLWAGAAPASKAGMEPGLTATLDRTSTPVGGTVTLTLQYRLPEGASPAKEIDITGLEDLTEVGRNITPDEITIRFMVDRLGSWKTGPITLSYLDARGQRQHLTADPVSLTVLSNLGDKPDEAVLRPLQDIMPVKSPWRTVWFWIACLAGAALLAAGIFWWFKGRPHGKSTLPVPDPPHVRALSALEGLEGEGWFEKGAYKTYYFRFSEILRQYLEAIRGFPAAEYTTEEIVRRIERPLDRRLLPLLKQADAVKFADAVPTPAKKDDLMKQAMDYVRESVPREPTTPRDNRSHPS